MCKLTLSPGICYLFIRFLNSLCIMFQLHFENQVFSKIDDFERTTPDFPVFAKAAFAFCKAWLAGEQTFSQATSGSTGTPKQITVSRQQMEASAKATGAFFKTDSRSKLLCCLNPAYIAGKMMLVRAMVWDCEVILTEPSANPLQQIDLEIDFIAMVPLQVQACMDDDKSCQKLKKINHLIIGGAPISAKLKFSLIETGIQAWQTFGMTETVSHIALAPITSHELIYQVLPGVQFGQDSRGALWIKSEMSGPEPIQTNDLIEPRSDSSFIWLGRVDFVINSGGIKIHPELLEAKIEPLLQLYFPDSLFFIFGEKDEKLGEKVMLLIESKSGEEKQAGELQNALKASLEKYEVPKGIYFLPSFLMTPSGKINRAQTQSLV